VLKVRLELQVRKAHKALKVSKAHKDQQVQLDLKAL
jgi:hypothetical protein